MSIVRISELQRLTTPTSGSLFYMAQGNGPIYDSAAIKHEDLFSGVITTDTTRYFGSFSSSQTQTTTGGTQSFTYDSTDLSNGFMIGSSTSQIKALHAGTYNLQFSAQITRTSGGNQANTFIWFRKNGTDIPNSNTDIGFANNNSYMVAAWNIILQMEVNDYVEVMWGTDDSHIQIAAIGSNTYGPSIPSIITSITQV